MSFDPDVNECLTAAAWLVNSVGPPDRLQEVADLERFLDEHHYTGRLDRDRAELESVRASRTELRRLLTTERDEAPEVINTVLRTGGAVPQLVRHAPRGWHLHAVDATEPLATRLLVETALAMSAVVISGETSRISTCAASRCENVVVDLTRNRTKRFCGVTCGNRAAAAAYRLRQSTG
ncbi:Zn-ribbon-like protein [Arthrobacter sp. RIT-PI-e]|uniref:CGNR zinc finger domain-containing protein n=1 Tax=Arthrobacter sp. RIT-PI-e TaxID=1681197 RepID=UPI0006766E92|nr:CGNR zinc finger domain-containing protein [Arthrobacter sp. RIT-PI-e]KNC19482.1 Zn-ribbon-like protein [Arthrobacter sp. RIT-PI-e]